MTVKFDERLRNPAFCNHVEGLKVILTSAINAANEEGKTVTFNDHVMWYGGLNLFADETVITETAQKIQRDPSTIEDECAALREHIVQQVEKRLAKK